MDNPPGPAAAGGLRVLITGFGPFPGAPHNPTVALVARLAALRLPALADVSIVGHVFPTSYAAVDAELPGLLATHRPDMVLMFGLAARTPYLRIETRARPRQSVLMPDVAGRLTGATPLRPPARAPGPFSAIPGRAPFARLRAVAMQAGVPVRLSHDAGRYLCNYLYRQALQAEPPVALVSFIHVPKLSRVARPRRATKPTLRAKPRIKPRPVPKGRVHRAPVTATGLARAGEAMLLVLVAAARAASRSGTGAWPEA